MTAIPIGEGKIYSATYSNVPVYEFKVGADSVMRRRVDDWVNATHILKAAGLDKPSRTRILEREVQKGVHEKIQGGYGKYQGTWVPLPDGKALAERNQVVDRLRPIFEYVPGDKSPPPAPKHTNATSARPRAPKLVAAPKNQPLIVRPDEQPPPSSFASTGHARTGSQSFSQSQQQQQYGSSMQQSFNDDESLAQASVGEASSMIGDDDNMTAPGSTRKRKRGMRDATLTMIEQSHILYGDQLLDYFMTVGDAPTAARVQPPTPPSPFQVDRPIDDQGNTALHWACAMGDVEIVKDLINRGADIHCLSRHEETPLVRAVLFTNNYEKRTMQEIAELLKHTITFRDWFGATVFHHLAATTRSKGKWKSARYYAEVLIEKLAEISPHREITVLLSLQDSNGDTAALTAAKNGCHKLAGLLLMNCPEAGDLQNKLHETANGILLEMSRRIQEQTRAQQQISNNINHVEDAFDPDEVHNGDENDLREGSSDTAVTPSRQHQSRVSEVTASALQRVSAIMEEANRQLARVYGDVKPSNSASASVNATATTTTLADVPGSSEALNASDDPKAVWEHIEAEREAIRRQIGALDDREAQDEPLESMVGRYKRVRQENESFVEQYQKLELENRFKQHESSTMTINGTTPPSTNPEDRLRDTYHLARQLAHHQSTRHQLIRELIDQRANAAASARMDVHRKLVALATGMPEGDLDPMASALADSLEFERANQNPSSLSIPVPQNPVRSQVQTPISAGGGRAAGGGGAVGLGVRLVDGHGDAEMGDEDDGPDPTPNGPGQEDGEGDEDDDM